jgi:hypothetical protein
MNANKLFFIGLVVVAVLYFVAVGGNARHGDESPSDYKSEEQQTALADEYKGAGLQAVADRFDPFAAKIDVFAAIERNEPPSPDQCKVIGTDKERAIVLSNNDESCLIRLPPDDDERYRKTTLSFNLIEPGTATRGGALKPWVLGRPQIGPLGRIPPHQGDSTGARLRVTLTMNERPSKQGITEIRANEGLKIAVQEKGGILQLTCQSCDKPIYVRAE